MDGIWGKINPKKFWWNHSVASLSGIGKGLRTNLFIHYNMLYFGHLSFTNFHQMEQTCELVSAWIISVPYFQIFPLRETQQSSVFGYHSCTTVHGLQHGIHFWADSFCSVEDMPRRCLFILGSILFLSSSWLQRLTSFLLYMVPTMLRQPVWSGVWKWVDCCCLWQTDCRSAYSRVWLYVWTSSSCQVPSSRLGWWLGQGDYLLVLSLTTKYAVSCILAQLHCCPLHQGMHGNGTS